MNPYITEGIEAKSSMIDLTVSLSENGKTSAIVIAVHTPSGIEIARAPNVTITEPYNKGKPPNKFDSRSQFRPKSKSVPNIENARPPSLTTKKSIRKRMTMENEAQRNRISSIG
jgi:hypothetical protein